MLLYSLYISIACMYSCSHRYVTLKTPMLTPNARGWVKCDVRNPNVRASRAARREQELVFEQPVSRAFLGCRHPECLKVLDSEKSIILMIDEIHTLVGAGGTGDGGHGHVSFAYCVELPVGKPRPKILDRNSKHLRRRICFFGYSADLALRVLETKEGFVARAAVP